MQLHISCSSNGELIENYCEQSHNEIIISKQLIIDGTYIPQAIEKAMSFIETSSDVYILVNHENVITKILPELGQDVILNFDDPYYISDYYESVRNYRINGCNIDQICPNIISELNLVNIKTTSHFPYLDSLNHKNIRQIFINSNHKHYQYNCKLNLDRVFITSNIENGDNFLELFFSQCNRIDDITISQQYLRLIPAELSDGITITVCIGEMTQLDEIFNLNVHTLNVQLYVPACFNVYDELREFIKDSSIPIIKVYANRVICNETKIVEFNKFLSNRNNASRFARVKPIMPSE